MSYLMPYLTFAATLVLVMLPVFLPLTIVAVVNLVHWRPTAPQHKTVVAPTQRAAVSHRRHVPSTA